MNSSTLISTDERPVRVTVRPSWDQWESIAQKQMLGPPLNRSTTLIDLVNTNSRELGSEMLRPTGLLWATGHQAWFWHPGILAKDIAASYAAQTLGGQALHLVLDHDVHASMNIQCPIEQNNILSIQDVTLAETRSGLPSASQPPVEIDEAIASIHKLKKECSSSNATLEVRLDALEDAFASLSRFKPFATLGQQMAALTIHLMRPWAGRLPVLLSSQISELDSFKQVLHWMMQDPTKCIEAYNHAVYQYPNAGIGLLAVGREFVELPLWLLKWGHPRVPVYADITDQKTVLVTADGQPIDLEKSDDGHHTLLAPRAILLTAVLRQLGPTGEGITLFIHGTGGGIYDQVTEAWWARWQPAGHETLLAPKAVVSADLRLTVQTPATGSDILTRAIWHAHHLRHNLDRQPDLSADALSLAQEKAMLLVKMKQEQDKISRATLFSGIHAINSQLALLMPQHLQAANESLYQAQIGHQNWEIAMKRDWPFAIYPPQSLKRLVHAIESELGHGDKAG